MKSICKYLPGLLFLLAFSLINLCHAQHLSEKILISPHNNVFYKNSPRDLYFVIHQNEHSLLYIDVKNNPLAFETEPLQTEFLESGLLIKISNNELSKIGNGLHSIKFVMDNGEVLRSQLKIVSDSEAKNYGLNVVAFNVGHGTSVLFFLPNGETLLVDTGYDHMAEKYTIPFMKSHLPVNRHGKQRIDHIFISHWHYDHFHGLNNILDAFDVGSIKYNLSEPERGDWRKDPYNYAKHGFEPVHSPQFKVGNVIDDIGGDDVKIKILNAAEFDLERYPYFHSKYFGEWDNANNRSLSFILKFKDFVFNFGGDTYQHGQIAMLQHFPELLAKTHVYHGNHHFHGGLSTDFLKHINPYLFIASACDVAYDRAAFVSDVMNNVVPTLEQESNIFIENLHTFEVGHIVIRVDGSLDWTDSSTEIIYETYYSEADDFPKFRILYLD